LWILRHTQSRNSKFSANERDFPEQANSRFDDPIYDYSRGQGQLFDPFDWRGGIITLFTLETALETFQWKFSILEMGLLSECRTEVASPGPICARVSPGLISTEP
jgi:hypothetical protein